MLEKCRQREITLRVAVFFQERGHFSNRIPIVLASDVDNTTEYDEEVLTIAQERIHGVDVLAHIRWHA